MKGWYGNSHKHSLASRGILTTLENRGESYYYGDLTIHEKKELGQNTEYAIMELLKRNTDYEIENVTHSGKGLGDIIVKVNTSCGECLFLVEVKNVESLHKHEVGKIAIKPEGHKALIKNSTEIGAIPIYIIRVNEDMGEGIFESNYYWKRAEYFSKDVNRMKGKWFTQVIHNALYKSQPIDESFNFFLKECDRRSCNG